MAHSEPVRVRFAPAPTGMMHLGNVRAAVINFLFAKKQNGTFVLRIEDTDQERNYDPKAENIIADLQWLNLLHDEGPGKEGAYGPYFQSQRNDFYTKALTFLVEATKCYRCFCTVEMLEKKRVRMQAVGLPPRYDRTCLALSDQEIEAYLAKKEPFIWRFKLDHEKTVVVNDLAHGKKTFELHHFSDFPLTRNDGSFTFIFANFVDDMDMKITHIFRGEDHLTNSACQASLFDAFSIPLPLYLHMPILCNVDGKKLSKRDFGFSLRDLKDAGFLPEAIVNYLGILGSSFEQEIMNMEQLTKAVNFDHMNTTGHIKYDVEKLRWVNRKWLHALPAAEFVRLSKPFLSEAYPQTATTAQPKIDLLLSLVQQDVQTLTDVIPALTFFFNYSLPTVASVLTLTAPDELQRIKKIALESLLLDEALFIDTLKKKSAEQGVPLKTMYTVLRFIIANTVNGMAIKDLLFALGFDEFKRRLHLFFDTLV